MQKELALDPVKLGWLLSGFSWAYCGRPVALGRVAGPLRLEAGLWHQHRCWSVCALLVGCTGYLPPRGLSALIFVLRLLSGLAQSPVFPGNGRIVAAWFPTAERGGASAIFNASQYFALWSLLRSLDGSLSAMDGEAVSGSWDSSVSLLAFAWWKLSITRRTIRWSRSRRSNASSAAAVWCNVDRGRGESRGNPLTWAGVSQLLKQRMLVGIYIGQFCITTLTYFFITWFPVYLVQARHMSILKGGFAAALPALCGCMGGVLGGVSSDALLRHGHSLTFARKAPIIAGMLLSVTMIACNYTSMQALMMVLMSLAFFGKGIGALGWTVIADTSPKELIGVNGGLFNFFGNIAGITTPIVIGSIVKKTGSFNDALIFVGAAALLAIFSYGVIVGEIRLK